MNDFAQQRLFKATSTVLQPSIQFDEFGYLYMLVTSQKTKIVHIWMTLRKIHSFLTL